MMLDPIGPILVQVIQIAGPLAGTVVGVWVFYLIWSSLLNFFDSNFFSKAGPTWQKVTYPSSAIMLLPPSLVAGVASGIVVGIVVEAVLSFVLGAVIAGLLILGVLWYFGSQ